MADASSVTPVAAVRRRTVTQASVIRQLVKANGKKCGAGFLIEFENQCMAKLRAAIHEHNGGRRTLDNAVAIYVFGSRR